MLSKNFPEVEIMTETELLQILKDSDAFLSGHFRLSSGLHSGNYLQCAQVFRFPRHSEVLSRALVEKVGQAGIRFDQVISPALGGILFGYEVSRQAGVPNIFAERDADNRMALRRGFVVNPGESFLVLEDVVTTGGSSLEVMRLVREAGGRVAALGCVADRSRGHLELDVPFFSLVTLDFPAYEPAKCPLCAQGLPLVKPGSKKV
jgi:orotate phosphoribosyltransferase